jgi:hypothetical protein
LLACSGPLRGGSEGLGYFGGYLGCGGLGYAAALAAGGWRRLDAVADEYGRALWGCSGCVRGGCGCGWAAAGHLDRDDGGAYVYCLALVDQQLGYRARERAGQFDYGLGGLDLDDDLAVGNRVARLDVPGYDLGLGQAFAHVREAELLELTHDAPPQ